MEHICPYGSSESEYWYYFTQILEYKYFKTIYKLKAIVELVCDQEVVTNPKNNNKEQAPITNDEVQNNDTVNVQVETEIDVIKRNNLRDKNKRKIWILNARGKSFD